MSTDNRLTSHEGSNTSIAYYNVDSKNSTELHNYIISHLLDKMPATDYANLLNFYKQIQQIIIHVSQRASQNSINTSSTSKLGFTNIKEGIPVDWQEKYIDKVDRDLSEIKSSLIDTEKHIERMINNTLTEIRDRDNQRHLETLAVNKRLDESSSEIRSELKTTNRWIIGLAITSIAAIAGIAISVLVLV